VIRLFGDIQDTFCSEDRARQALDRLFKLGIPYGLVAFDDGGVEWWRAFGMAIASATAPVEDTRDESRIAAARVQEQGYGCGGSDRFQHRGMTNVDGVDVTCSCLRSERLIRIRLLAAVEEVCLNN